MMRSRSPGRSPGRSPVQRFVPEKSDTATTSPRKIGFEGVSYELSGDLYLLLAQDTCIHNATLMPARSPRDKLLRLQPAERQFQPGGSTRRQLSDGRCALKVTPASLLQHVVFRAWTCSCKAQTSQRRFSTRSPPSTHEPTDNQPSQR